MKGFLRQIFIFFCMSFIINDAFAAELPKDLCKNVESPKVLKMINDWDIIADNTASIPTAFAFSGTQLEFSFVAKPKNPKNIVKINSHTGAVTVKAEAKDDFDIAIIAKNACGEATAKFNVWIDEEE